MRASLFTCTWRGTWGFLSGPPTLTPLEPPHLEHEPALRGEEATESHVRGSTVRPRRGPHHYHPYTTGGTQDTTPPDHREALSWGTENEGNGESRQIPSQRPRVPPAVVPSPSALLLSVKWLLGLRSAGPRSSTPLLREPGVGYMGSKHTNDLPTRVLWPHIFPAPMYRILLC